MKDEPRYLSREVDNVLRPPWRQWFVDYLPVTGDNDVELYVDGEGYGAALFDAIEAASKEILLTGLHFQPSWCLKRAPGVGHTLLSVLRRAVQRGCDVYLIVNQFWKDETRVHDPIRKVIIWQGSLDWYMPHTMALFEGFADLPPDKVHLRTDVHPGFVMSTHHQKTVVIDRRVCFVGGIDMTYVDGDRWDTNAHEIAESSVDDLRRYDLPEHFWHDVHCRIEGPAVQFVRDNFHARWNGGEFFKDVKQVTEHTIMGSYGHWISVARTHIEFTPEPKEERKPLFRFPMPPGCVYQEKTDLKLGPTEVHTRYPRLVTDAPAGTEQLMRLPAARVQVVRSMPAGPYTDDGPAGPQKPKWNLGPYKWERSTRDAYIIGIRAARDYIYLENQWISDEGIWAELQLAMRRNRENPRFRIVIVLPRRPLSAAGAGRDQDIDITGSVQAVQAECGEASQFGMYCLVREIRASRRDTIALSDKDKKQGAQIYVHSKIMIVDDCWSLIGSANAGGISLLGVYNVGSAIRTGDLGSTPDSELSVIIHDEVFARNFRETLWAEHLETKSIPGTPHEAADLMRKKAATNEARLRYAAAFSKRRSEDTDPAPPWVISAVQASARIIRSTPVEDAEKGVSGYELDASSPVSLDDVGTTFTIDLIEPPPRFRVMFCWWLRADGMDWPVTDISQREKLGSYGTERMVRIHPDTLHFLKVRNIFGPKQRPAKVCCAVLLVARGLADPRRNPNPGSGVYAPYLSIEPSFSVELAIELLEK